MHVCGVIVLRFFGRMIDGLLDRVFCIAGAIGLSQIPGIIQHYVDVLSGALAEARRNVETFREQAALVGRTLPEFIDKHLRNPDPDFQASGRAMQMAVERFEGYGAAFESLRDASIWQRPFLFFAHLDVGLWSQMDYRPTLPLNMEGLIYAAVGIPLGLLAYYGILRLPVYLFRKKDKDREQDGPPPARSPAKAA